MSVLCAIATAFAILVATACAVVAVVAWIASAPMEIDND